MRLRRSAASTFLIAIALLLSMRFLPSLVTTNIRLLPNDATYELTYDQAPATLFDAHAWDQSSPPPEHADPQCQSAGLPELRCFITHPQVERTQQLRFSPTETKKEVMLDVTDRVDSDQQTLLTGTDHVRLIRHSAFPVDKPVSSYSSNSEVPGLGREDRDEERTGLQYAFPFASEWRSYNYFDTYPHSSYPIDFQDREERRGTTLYRFHQDVAPILMGTVSMKGEAGQFYSPSELRDMRTSSQDIVSLNGYYRVSRTVWVEPKTGTIVDTLETPEVFLARDLDDARSSASPSDRTIFSTTYQLSEQSQDLMWQRASHGVHVLKLLNIAIYLTNIAAVALIAVGIYLARKK